MRCVVLSHQIMQNEIASVHREGCKDIKREADRHASVISGPFDSLEDALSDYIDSEMEEMGWSREDVKVHNCCRQSGAQRNKKEATMASKTPDTNLGDDLVAALTTQFPALSMVEKKAYRRMTVEGKTLGYLYLGARKAAVEVSDGHGKYEYMSVSKKGDVRKVVTALKAVAKRTAK